MVACVAMLLRQNAEESEYDFYSLIKKEVEGYSSQLPGEELDTFGILSIPEEKIKKTQDLSRVCSINKNI